jgi:hypothetical protein
MMKVYGSYYKNTVHGKKQEPFELELTTDKQELGELRQLATPILREKDNEFRGIRTLEKSTTPIVPINAQDALSRKSLQDEVIRQKAKELKIKNHWNAKIENLIKLIEEKENAI